jgi:two-component system phosphate regulon response regulator PhoB
MANKKILTVDDDEAISSGLRDMLELEGFDTVWAKNGQVALDYLLAVPDVELPDLVLLDYMMPVMNGQEFCREKIRHPKLRHIPVVMMTAGGNLVNVMDLCATDGYMAKPMDIETVVRMVKHFLGPEEIAPAY